MFPSATGGIACLSGCSGPTGWFVMVCAHLFQAWCRKCSVLFIGRGRSDGSNSSNCHTITNNLFHQMEGTSNRLDFRCLDACIFNALVISFGHIGLKLKSFPTDLLATQSQTLSTLNTGNFGPLKADKGVGCFLSMLVCPTTRVLPFANRIPTISG